MKRKFSMKSLSVLTLTFCCSICFAQTFVAETQLPEVHSDGFYNIALTPENSAYLNHAFTNMRIFDEKNREVPYLLRVDVPHTVTNVFRDYAIAEKKQIKNCCTSLVLHNPDQRLSNNMQLLVKNADVTKEATLLGSDDKVHWFALNQHLILTPASSIEGTSEMKIVNFPLSNYQYYSLQIDDSTSAPLNILTAGYFEVQTEVGKYAEVPLKEIIKSDSAKEKKTYVHVRFNGSMTVDKFELTLKGAPFFLRKAMVHVPKTRNLKGGKTETYYDPLQEIEITSKRPTLTELQGLKVKELLIIIDNEDNPVLELDRFNAYQLNRYATAWLTTGTNYTVKVGPPALMAPIYDISFFKDSIPENAGVIQMGAIKFNSVDRGETSSTFFTTKAYIWVAVILVIVILGLMSVRMLKTMNNEH
ncbi:MAG TPA: hypothetical protein VK589_30670 [Chryseolinea sp.]|nr:hypothetical protein [Chryseolinea sp.]